MPAVHRAVERNGHNPTDGPEPDPRQMVPIDPTRQWLVTLGREAERLSEAHLSEYLDLPQRDRRLVTAESLDRWTDGLTADDFTLTDVVNLERRRQVAQRTMRQGAELTDLEYRLFRFFQRHDRKTLTYIEIARHLWGSPTNKITGRDIASRDGYASPMVATIHVLVGHLRKKLEIDRLRPQHIATIWGVGYRYYVNPPSLDDGENYDRRDTESQALRRYMQEQFGIVEGTFVAASSGDVVITRSDEEGPLVVDVEVTERTSEPVLEAADADDR